MYTSIYAWELFKMYNYPTDIFPVEYGNAKLVNNTEYNSSPNESDIDSVLALLESERFN